MRSLFFCIVAFFAGIFFRDVLVKLNKNASNHVKNGFSRKKEKWTMGDILSTILPLVVVSPYIKPENIVSRVQKEMYLAIPDKYSKSIKTSGKLRNKDTLFRPLHLPGIPDKEVNKAIELARNEISQCFVDRKEGYYFNGPKLGVIKADGFSRTPDCFEDPILHIDFFRTDHFTSRVVQNAVTRLKVNADDLSISTLNGDYDWIRTSISISIIAIIRSTNDLIMTHRASTASYSNGQRWIYVSATETLTEADYNIMTQQIDFANCVIRGLKEELGITEDMCDMNSIKLYDLFFEKHFFRDGIVASIELDDKVTFADVYSLEAKDKQLEVDDVFVIKNTEKEIERCILDNHDQIRPQTAYALKTYISKQTEIR